MTHGHTTLGESEVTITADTMKHVVDSFNQVLDAITSTFHVASTSDTVSAASRGEIPRNGRCLNGWKYSIHGAGFTVTLPSGGHVHINWSREGDYFKEYDVAFFMETSGIPERPSLPEIVESLNLLCDQQVIRYLGEGRYSLAMQALPTPPAGRHPLRRKHANQ